MTSLALYAAAVQGIDHSGFSTAVGASAMSQKVVCYAAQGLLLVVRTMVTLLTQTMTLRVIRQKAT